MNSSDLKGMVECVTDWFNKCPYFRLSKIHYHNDFHTFHTILLLESRQLSSDPRKKVSSASNLNVNMIPFPIWARPTLSDFMQEVLVQHGENDSDRRDWQGSGQLGTPHWQYRPLRPSSHSSKFWSHNILNNGNSKHI